MCLTRMLSEPDSSLKYENVGLQGEITAYQAQLQVSQNIALRPQSGRRSHLSTLCRIAELVERYVDHCRNPSKDNIVIIVRKHTTPENDKYHNFPYYISRIQRRKWYVKLRWLERHFPDHEVIDNPNSIHVFNRLEDRLRLIALWPQSGSPCSSAHCARRSRPKSMLVGGLNFLIKQT